MRRALAAVAAIIMLASPAAADGSRWNHAGFYAGLNAGYSSAVLQSSDPVDWAAAGLHGGVHIGWGIQGKSGIYVGIEMDAAAKDIAWKASDGMGTTVTASGRWLGSGRIRVGQTIGPVLMFGTLGGAVTEQRVAMTGLGSDSELRYGWVAGGGVDVMATQTMTLRLEGLRFEFPDKLFTFAGGGDKIGTTETVVRVGLSFKLQ